MKFDKRSDLLFKLLVLSVSVLTISTQKLTEECDLYLNECIPLKDCNILNNLLIGTGNLITPDIAEKLEQSKCLNSSVNVCCPKTTSTQDDDIDVDIGTRFADETCETPTKESGTCTAVRKCPSIFKIVSKGRITTEESSYLRASQCDYKNRTPYVCCPNQSGQNSGGLNRAGNLLPSFEECGILATDRIIGGDKTKIDEYPWTGLIQYADSNNNGRRSFGCGSSLINNRYVITAAHCASSSIIPSRFRPTLVRLGEWDTSTTEDCDYSRGVDECVDEPVQDIAIEKIIVHENYRKSDKNVHNDIALIRLRQPAQLNYFVAPVCLPRTDALRSVNLVDKTVFVTGWGITEERVKSNIKLKVDLQVVSNAACQRAFPSKKIVPTQICAGGEEGKDSCGGDSGGPLMKTQVIGKKQFWYVVGLVSYGSSNCGSKDLPGVYTRVSEYMTWIESNLRI